jgi:predicted DNA-binding transcriptional regulator AlpA
MRPVPRRGLSRDEAAMYVGISAAKFDELIRDGRMPSPVNIDRRKAFDELSTETGTRASSWDGI